jgi:hypothetical protein
MEDVHKITHAIISSQITLNHLEEVKHTTLYRQTLKNKINLLLPELIKNEPYFDEFFSKVEDSTVQTYEAYDTYIKNIASVPIWECQNISMIIQAYKADPKSIEGICKKILKSNV